MRTSGRALQGTDCLGNNNLKRKDTLKMKPEMADVAEVSEELNVTRARCGSLRLGRRSALTGASELCTPSLYGSFNPRRRSSASNRRSLAARSRLASSEMAGGGDAHRPAVMRRCRADTEPHGARCLRSQSLHGSHRRWLRPGLHAGQGRLDRGRCGAADLAARMRAFGRIPVSFSCTRC